MHYLIYMSSAPRKFSDGELALLLDRARKNNAALAMMRQFYQTADRFAHV